MSNENYNTPNALNALDLISRQAAIDALEDKYMSFGIFREQRAAALCIEVIKNLPSAQPERKTGLRHVIPVVPKEAAIAAVRCAFWDDDLSGAVQIIYDAEMEVEE